MAPQIVSILPQGHEESEYVLSFEIGQWEGGQILKEGFTSTVALLPFALREVFGL